MIVRSLPLGLAAVLLVAPARAQPVSPDPQGDLPPDRVGRIAAVTGAVSFHLAGATEWQVASRNLPITNGTALWVAAPTGGVSPEASLGVSDDRIVLAPSTELDVDRLDEQTLVSTQPQGESYWHLRSVATANTYAIHTPRGTVTMATAGRYEVVSGDTDHPTTITVLDGTATLTDVPTSQEIGPGQTLTVTGDRGVSSFTSSIGKTVQDAFLRHVLAEETPARPRAPDAPAILSEMTGSEALYDVGQWTENAEYGPVWYPPTADYVPYRQGRWAYVAPWGWTWVDDAPWGFAPSHYGRWAQFDNRWGWVPGRDWGPGRPPIYAPALVGFIGGAALGAGLGTALGASLGLAHGPLVGWAPLGPRDAYRPPYRVNERMIQSLNRPTGATIEINNSHTIVNRSAMTIVPTQVLTTSAPVAGAFRSESVGAIGASPVLQYRPQAVPTRATIGATRAVLQQVNPTGLTVPAGHVGEGPRLAGPGRPEPGLATPGLARPAFAQPGFAQPGFAGTAPEAPRPALGASSPQIGAGAILGGAAIGAVAGGLLHSAARPEALPALRQRGDLPPGLRVAGPGETGGIARPRPPTSPNVLDPAAPNARRGDDVLNGRPSGFAPPAIPRPAPTATPIRPELPRVVSPPAPLRERLPEVRYGMPAQPLQQEPRRQQLAVPQREFQRAPAQFEREAPMAVRQPSPLRLQQNAPPRRPEERQAPEHRQEQRPEQRSEQRPEPRPGR